MTKKNKLKTKTKQVIIKPFLGYVHGHWKKVQRQTTLYSLRACTYADICFLLVVLFVGEGEFIVVKAMLIQIQSICGQSGTFIARL